MKKFIDEKTLKRLSDLTKLEIQPSETEKYINLMNSALEKLEKLDDIDTEGLEELINSYDMILTQYPDIINDGNKVDELMNSAPKQLYNYFVVPKVIENK